MSTIPTESLASTTRKGAVLCEQMQKPNAHALKFRRDGPSIVHSPCATFGDGDHESSRYSARRSLSGWNHNKNNNLEPPRPAQRSPLKGISSAASHCKLSTMNSISMLSRLRAIAMAALGLAFWGARRQGAGVSSPKGISRNAALAHPDDGFLDSLTLLPSRPAYEERLAFATASSRRTHSRIAVLHVDLDGFRLVNDTLGYETGDQAIMAIAQRLRLSVGKAGMVSRLAGDEFLVLLEDIADRDSAAMVAELVLSAVGKPIVLVGRQLQVSASVGIALYPHDGPAAGLLAQAASATQLAKLAGRARFRFYAGARDDQSSDRLTLQSDLRAALEHDEFELHYQPKFRASDSMLCGAEALLRWHHPTRGAVSPAVFIPVAEAFGLILPIGQWVLDRAVAQAAQWLEQGFRVPVAVNLSLVQLRQSDLVDCIVRTLTHHHLPASMLVLEITESAAMEDAERTLEVLRRLADVGIGISIDDFGTGYSSLSYLRRFTAHELKVDRSFVTDVSESDEARSIVTAVVQMAHALGLRVVAEGVETEQQRVESTQIGCDTVQGFLFDRPLTAIDFVRSYSPHVRARSDNADAGPEAYRD